MSTVAGLSGGDSVPPTALVGNCQAMALCSKCGKPLEARVRFCGSCGTAVNVKRPSAPAPAQVMGGTKLMAQAGGTGPPAGNTAKADPFAQTVLAEPLDRSVPPPQVPASVSPMAASVMATPGSIAKGIVTTKSAVRTPPHAARALPALAYTSGSRVLVAWSDGHSYPGTVRQAIGPRLLVVFSNGAEHWIDQAYVSPA